MLVNTVHIPQLGLVNFTQSLRARNLRITIKLDKTITVTIPRYGNAAKAREFLLSKTSWIQRHLRRIERYANKKTPDLNIDLQKAQQDLFERLDYFSKMYNFPYNRATFRRQKTKWGSCSGKNNINLNINIAGLPQELQDYILLHELVHTKHKNHGREFWAELNKLAGDAKKLRKEMRRYRL